MRPQRWTMTHAEDGTWAVARGNRPMSEGLTGGQAQSLIGRNRMPGEKVTQVEQDGYLTDLTARFVDRQASAPKVGNPTAETPQSEQQPLRRGWPKREWPRHEWAAADACPSSPAGAEVV